VSEIPATATQRSVDVTKRQRQAVLRRTSRRSRRPTGGAACVKSKEIPKLVSGDLQRQRSVCWSQPNKSSRGQSGGGPAVGRDIPCTGECSAEIQLCLEYSVNGQRSVCFNQNGHQRAGSPGGPGCRSRGPGTGGELRVKGERSSRLETLRKQANAKRLVEPIKMSSKEAGSPARTSRRVERPAQGGGELRGRKGEIQVPETW
jgi:hypothetical protein